MLSLLCFACQQSDKTTPFKHAKTVSLEELEGKKDSLLLETSESKGKEEVPDYDTINWTEMHRLDETFLLDIKYATEDNFVEEQLYDCPRCFLRPVAAEALNKVHGQFKEKGLRIKLLDCYRPKPVQQRLWDKVPNASYVTPPSKGSMHNRGLAVDLTLVDSQGNELDMGTPYDFFGRKAHHTHRDLPKEVLDNRQLLKKTMEEFGFKSIRTEWWHYSYVGGRFKIDDMEWECH